MCVPPICQLDKGGTVKKRLSEHSPNTIALYSLHDHLQNQLNSLEAAAEYWGLLHMRSLACRFFCAFLCVCFFACRLIIGAGCTCAHSGVEERVLGIVLVDRQLRSPRQLVVFLCVFVCLLLCLWVACLRFCQVLVRPSCRFLHPAGPSVPPRKSAMLEVLTSYWKMVLYSRTVSHRHEIVTPKVRLHYRRHSGSMLFKPVVVRSCRLWDHQYVRSPQRITTKDRHNGSTFPLCGLD